MRFCRVLSELNQICSSLRHVDGNRVMVTVVFIVQTTMSVVFVNVSSVRVDIVNVW